MFDILQCLNTFRKESDIFKECFPDQKIGLILINFFFVLELGKTPNREEGGRKYFFSSTKNIYLGWRNRSFSKLRLVYL